MKQLLLVVLASLALTACRQSALSDADKTEVVDGVRQTLQNYCSDMRKSGLTAELKYLDKSADFFWVPPGHPKAISYEEVAAAFLQNAPRYTSIDNSFDDLRVIPLTRELATYTGKIHSTMTDTSGKTSSFDLLETGIMIKRKEGWKMLHGQTSFITAR